MSLLARLFVLFASFALLCDAAISDSSKASAGLSRTKSSRRQATVVVPDKTNVHNKHFANENKSKAGAASKSKSVVSVVEPPRVGGITVPSIRIDENLSKALIGAAVMAGIEKLMKEILRKLDVKFPPMLAGCLVLLGFLLALDVVQPKIAASVAKFLEPGSVLLAKWLPMFFIPGLALLPMAPSVGGSIEAAKVLGVLVIGFIYTIITVGVTVVSFRGGSLHLLGTKSVAKTGEKNVSKAPKPKPFTQDQVMLFGSAAAVAGILAVVTSKNGHPLAKFCETSFLTLFTFAGYMWAARLPSFFVQVVHPLVTTCCLILIMIGGWGAVTNRSFMDVMREYKVGSLDLRKTGSGDILLYLLGPCAVSFAVSMFGRRALLQKNIIVVASAVFVSSVGGLIGTAAFVRAIALGGKTLGSKAVRLSVLSRNVTTALALALTSMIGGDLAIAAAACVITGVMGGTYGKAILQYLGISDPITRGLCIGASAQGLGVASMADEPDAFPFAAMAMVFTALTSTTLVAFPAVKDALVKLATGS